MISDGLWKRSFASDPDIVGKTIQVNAYPFTIVGVTEPGFSGTIVSLRMDLFVPVMMQPQLRGFDFLQARESPLIWGLGRVRPDMADFRQRYEPGHPSADANGNVKYPNVNPLIEMTDMKEAQRSYEANLNLITASRRMIQRTLEILKS